MKALLGVNGLSVLACCVGAGAATGVALGVIPTGPIKAIFSSPVAVEQQHEGKIAKEKSAGSVQEPSTQEQLALLSAKPDPADLAGPLDTAPAPKQSKQDERENLPEFGVMRVEKNGSLLIAGKAQPNSRVELMQNDGTIISHTKADTNGDFVILPDIGLKQGEHVLILKSIDHEGREHLSKQTGIVQMPREGGQIIALIDEEGKASRFVSSPKIVAALTDKAVQEKFSNAEVKKDHAQDTMATLAAAVPAVDQNNDKADKQSQEVVGSEKLTDALKQSFYVNVEAVEVEGQEIYIAGAVPYGQWVRIYLNNDILGTAQGTSDNRFLLSVKHNLAAGQHAIRADVINKQTGVVLSRAQVPLVHEVAAGEEVVGHSLVQKFADNRAEDTTTELADNALNNDKGQKTDEKTQDHKQMKLAEDREISAEEGAKQEVHNSADKGQIGKDHAQKHNAQNVVVPLRTGQALIVKKGDSLWRISRKTYGRGIRYTTIYDANKDQIRDPDRIYVGQIFKLPLNSKQPLKTHVNNASIQ